MPTGLTPRRTPRLLRAISSLTIGVLAVSGFATLGSSAAVAAPTATTVSGTVFRDFNSNGTFDTGAAALSGIANDRGVAGVTVRAYTATNTLFGSAVVSAADGTYTISGTSEPTAKLRLEFSTLPTGFSESAVHATGTAGRTGSSVQFVAAGSTGVNFGINKTGDFSQSNAPVMTAIQYAGAASAAAGGTSLAFPSVVATPYNAGYTSGSVSNSSLAVPYPGRVELATFGETGAVWGTAYNSRTNDLLIAATYKRHSGLGSLGLGGIYKVSDVLVNGAASAAGTTTPWLDVTTLGINVGTAASATARGLSASDSYAADVDAFANAGKVGIGGMVITDNGTRLSFVNLFDKSIYTLDISNIAAPKLLTVTPTGLTAGQRPWALNSYNGSLYVGYVTTGETAGNVANPGIAAAAAGLVAGVKRTAAPLSTTSAWTDVLTGAALGYAKGDVYNSQLGAQAKRWNTWTDTWTFPGGAVGGTGGSPWQIYPQAILTSLFFDADGYLSLGFLDRTGVQGGNRNISTVPGDTAHYETGSSGDLLLAAPNANQTSWALESAGVAGARTTAVTARTTNTEGPGGGEFYPDDNGLRNNGGGTHHEVSLGALAGIQGTNELVSHVYDPLAGIRLSGSQWYSTTSGNMLAGYEQTKDPGTGTISTLGTFQKGGGLGSVQILAEQAPIEVGNRVWFDADQNGRQDADEPSLAGVTVELRNTAGTVTKSVVTGADGSYYFSSDRTSPFYVAGFAPGSGDYTVTFVKPTTGNVTFSAADAALFGTVSWASMSLTAKDAAGSGDAGSDPVQATGVYGFTAGAPGDVNHSIDAGYVANQSFTVQKVVSSAGGSASAGQTFSMIATAVDFRGNPYVVAPSPISLAAGAMSAAVAVPSGTRVTVTEAGTADYRTVSVSPSASTLVQGTSASPFAFVVTNTLRAPGTFTVAKTVTGPAAGWLAANQSYTVSYSYPGQTGSHTLTVTNGNTSAQSVPIPYGTVVTLSELAVTGAPARVGFEKPTWASISGGAVVSNPDGTASLTIGDGNVSAVSLTNPTVDIEGGFSITKVVGAGAAASVPNDFAFTIRYSTDGGTTWLTRTVTKAAPTTTVTGLPAGTVVRVEEVAPTGGPVDVEWGTPVFSGNVTTTGGVTTLVVPANGTNAVTLTNPTTRLNGTFSVSKQVTGGAASTLTPGTKFTINYTYPGQSLATSVQVENGGIFTSEAIPRGTVVTISETAPTSGLPANSSWGTPVFSVGGVPLTGSTFTIGSAPIALTLTNPTKVTPLVTIVKGDVVGSVKHPADTVATGAVYTPGEQRTIEFTVTNTGTDALREVVLGDKTVAGNAVTNITWTLPNGQTLTSVQGVPTQWPDTFGAGTAQWLPGQVITGVGTLVVPQSVAPYMGTATVDAVGVNSLIPVAAANDYHAFTGAIQVIKYNGELADPAIKDGSGAWITPSKSAMDPAQDADDADHAVVYPVGLAQDVRWVVTNTGTTALTNLTLADATTSGVPLAAGWTADLSAFGYSSTYSFANGAVWPGVLAPGESFYAHGTLTLPATSTHAGSVTVVGSIVVPGPGAPVVATNDLGAPATVTDNDPFTAKTGVGPFVDIQKGDGTGTTIVNEADTMATGQLYAPGETRTIVFRVQNTGDENLRSVVLTNTLLSGASVKDLTWTFPDGSTTAATLVNGKLTAEWAATVTGTTTWAPHDYIYGTATLTMLSSDAPHVGDATVTAVGALSLATVTDHNPYNAFTGGIQVIKYDGDQPDPAVKDGSGNWVIPSKADIKAGQDADSAGTAVALKPGVAERVRWVISNTGTTGLSNISIDDVVATGPAMASSYKADLSAVGGPADYDFMTDGPWQGILLPGQSFFVEGLLTLNSGAHQAVVNVIASVVVPEVDGLTLVPTGNPSRDLAGRAILAAAGANGAAFAVTDSDPFNAAVIQPLALTGTDPITNALLALLLLLGGLIVLAAAALRRRSL